MFIPALEKRTTLTHPLLCSELPFDGQTSHVARGRQQVNTTVVPNNTSTQPEQDRPPLTERNPI